MINESISVRELVEFSYYSEDISSNNSINKMNEGSESHRARQALLEDDYEAEVHISATFTGEQYTLKVTGRMDVFCGSFRLPIIEEIKLCDESHPPKTPINRHMYQLYTYAAMYFLNHEECDSVKLILNYVNVKGMSIITFEETILKEPALQLVRSLIEYYISFRLQEFHHRNKRNKSIKKTVFPFAQFRTGQREFAAQVFTAIKNKRNLYASLPTGTGKTIATLYPAIKAVNEGYCSKIIYLTARTAARQSPLISMRMLIEKGLDMRVLVITAKEKACINDKIDCNPESCPYAKGHFIREKDAMHDILEYSIWNFELIRMIAQRHNICPFEFSLSLYYIADVVICDYNYVFDPFVVLQRAADEATQNTILVDEAHHLLDRLRDGLSASLSTKVLKEYRSKIKDAVDSKCPLYRNVSHIIRVITEIPEQNEKQTVLDKPPDDLLQYCEALRYSCADFFGKDDPKLKKQLNETVLELYKNMSSTIYALNHIKSGYKIVLEQFQSNRNLYFHCLDPRFRILESTSPLAGSIYFSATFEPLHNMKTLFGGSAQDAVFALPSPFPKENLLIGIQSISTYYNDRKDTVGSIAKQIIDVVESKKGNYIIYLPSYEYLSLMQEQIECIYSGSLLVQEKDLSDSQKEEFIQAFTDGENTLGICVLGGSFSEGIDLPGKQLIGVFIVGVGLSMPDFKTDLLKDYFDEKYGQGYTYAYQIPAMQRVLQACGRVIRSETDRGIIVLFDQRYCWKSYRDLLPQHWEPIYQDIQKKIQEFDL